MAMVHSEVEKVKAHAASEEEHAEALAGFAAHAEDIVLELRTAREETDALLF